ncbi:hypothetical protein HPB50_001810 [Hyalomma asiaticum]|uniref:Uncharacterized protein n=1 Tax=Hyalomma asiaticum TaxID=266040 RepID=A0ACB7TD31_HYAAI|nr:hypothetical protein HPB50_001810 [Hyalomma asiaticum]
MMLAHVSGLSRSGTVCSRCTETHTTDTCKARRLKRIICDGPHGTSLKEYSVIRREMAILKKLVREDTSRREAVASIKRKRCCLRGRSQTLGSLVTAGPCPKSPAPLPPKLSVAEATVKTDLTCKTANNWPELRKSNAPSERHQVSTPRDIWPVPCKLTEENKQIVSMFCSLAIAIRALLYKTDTRIARSASQVLDAINSVLSSLQKRLA